MPMSMSMSMSMSMGDALLAHTDQVPVLWIQPDSYRPTHKSSDMSVHTATHMSMHMSTHMCAREHVTD